MVRVQSNRADANEKMVVNFFRSLHIVRCKIPAARGRN